MKPTPVRIAAFSALVASIALVALAAGRAATAAEPATAAAPAIKLNVGKEAVEATIDGKPFTTYRFAPAADDPAFHRPYFWPVVAADGVELTSDQTRLMQKQKTDHPHHRSVWIAHGDVNGIDHWTHKTKKMVHLKFARIDADGFVEELAWEGKEEGKPVLTETRTVKFIAYPDGARGIDVTSALTAASGDVVFKVNPLNGRGGVEAGWLAVRVAPAMSAAKEKQLTSSAPANTEKDCRSKPATWCDFSAPIEGKMYGVALFDHPDNLGHPTPFHVRAFGFLSHIGTHDWTLKANQTQTFRHRLVFHSGDGASAKLDERYKEFAAK